MAMTMRSVVLRLMVGISGMGFRLIHGKGGGNSFHVPAFCGIGTLQVARVCLGF